VWCQRLLYSIKKKQTRLLNEKVTRVFFSPNKKKSLQRIHKTVSKVKKRFSRATNKINRLGNKLNEIKDKIKNINE